MLPATRPPPISAGALSRCRRGTGASLRALLTAHPSGAGQDTALPLADMQPLVDRRTTRLEPCVLNA